MKKIVDEAYRRTIQLMEDKKEQVILIAELLLVKETITNNDVAELIGKRPYKQSEEYEQYASSGWGEEANKIVIDPRDAHPGKTFYPPPFSHLISLLLPSHSFATFTSSSSAVSSVSSQNAIHKSQFFCLFSLTSLSFFSLFLPQPNLSLKRETPDQKY